MRDNSKLVEFLTIGKAKERGSPDKIDLPLRDTAKWFLHKLCLH